MIACIFLIIFSYRHAAGALGHIYHSVPVASAGQGLGLSAPLVEIPPESLAVLDNLAASLLPGNREEL